MPVLVIQLVLFGCFGWWCAPERTFRVSALELPASLFPDGAIVNHMHPMSDEFGTIDNGMQSIFWQTGNGGAGYLVYRYPTTSSARNNFEFYKTMLIEPSNGEVWNPPAELNFSSTTADEIYVGCIYFGGQHCEMLARYQEYVLSFRTSIDEMMAYSDFENVLLFIDKQITERIYP